MNRAEALLVPKAAMERDGTLQEATAQAGLDLAELRWHWTRNEANPDRMTAAEYGRQVGVNPGTIARAARAWEIRLSPDSGKEPDRNG